MKAILLFLLFTISSAVANNYTYELSVAAMFKDEMDIMPEWIEYNRMMGVEHFWLYNNGSKDHYLEFLYPYIAKGIVELIEWPGANGVNWCHIQARAYNDAIKRAKGLSKWVAIIDIDEFIVPIHHELGLLNMLKEFEKIPDCGGITLYWLMFGTSHIYDVEEGKILTESLLYRSDQYFPANDAVKTICRPECVKDCSVHTCVYHPPFKDYTLKKDHFFNYGPQEGAIAIDPVRIHHYWTRTDRYMMEVKAPRRSIHDGKPMSQELLDFYKKVLNEVYDDTILPYIPELKQRVQKPSL